MKTNLILYVRDQRESAKFYASVLRAEPILDVPGMTEFRLGQECILGLMPEEGIKRLLEDRVPDPARARGIPRAELYLTVDDPVQYLRRALLVGATELSPVLPRDWGDEAGYCSDPDGHVVAFARAAGPTAHGPVRGPIT